MFIPYNENNKEPNVLKHILINRGIKDVDAYLKLDESSLCNPEDLCNIEKASELFQKNLDNNARITILVDCDVDGLTSAAIMYNYIKCLGDYDVHYKLHNKTKAHGLNDVFEDLAGMTPHFLIVPDAGTNDVVECKALKELGWDILILDHHDQEENGKENEKYAVIVNNQMSPNYDNKDLCGAGVVYKFVKYLDEKNWNEFADDFLDLVALGNISDVMDMRSVETRYLVELGLHNIKNNMFKAMITAQDYSMNGVVNIHNVQWYITPPLNGCVRFGEQEELELLFRGFIEDYEEFEYKKRATKTTPALTTIETIYERAARLSKNAKARQDKARDNGFKELVKIADQLETSNKLLVLDGTNIIDSALSGVIAIKLAEKYDKPCLLLQKRILEDGTMTYGGSARNVNYGQIEDLKSTLNQSGIVQLQGHGNAAGIVKFGAFDDTVRKLEEYISTQCNYIVGEKKYRYDYQLSQDELDIDFIRQFESITNYLGQGIDEPMVVVSNITLDKNAFSLIGKNSDTITFELGNIKFIQFKCDSSNKLYSFLENAWSDEDEITFSIIGVPEISEYNGLKTPQIRIVAIE